MIAVRRVYILAVSALSLLLVTWAVIAVERELIPLGTRAPISSLAWEIAVVVVALPFYLAHWIWAQHLADAGEERGSVLRRIYLYGIMSITLAAFVTQLLDLLGALLGLVLAGPAQTGLGAFQTGSPAETIANAMAAMVTLAVVWLYHAWTAYDDGRAVPSTGNSAIVRRLYVLGFSAFGLTLTVSGAIQVLRWLLAQFGDRPVIGDATGISLADEIPRLVVGLGLWLVFWLQAQLLFKSGREQELESALRKFYLYLAIFAGAAGTISGATYILSELFRQALGLALNVDLQNPIAVMVVMAAVWAYHSLVLRQDTMLAPTEARPAAADMQEGVRRLYSYLVAAVGLAAFLAGLITLGRVLIEATVGGTFGNGLKEQLAWGTAALLAGFPVWLIPWRGLQNAAAAGGSGAAGQGERQSLIRKIYLYGYLLVASLTVLGSAIYILSRLLSLALGGSDTLGLVSDLANALGFGLIAAGVWVVHGLALRDDGRLAKRDQAERVSSTTVAVVDDGEGRWGSAVLDALRREWPDLQLRPIGLTPAAAAAMHAPAEQELNAAALSSAGIIVGPWSITAAAPRLAQALNCSKARKLLVPASAEGWEWVGVEPMNEGELVQQSVQAVRRALGGGGPEFSRSAAAAVVVLVAVACAALPIIFFALSLLAGLAGD
ncbi:MAG: DUF5671 domain-containing protein [Chloroflexi bacterium]|nr:DUF5671 domain-containing protein [Chloroflexota bacterium]